MIRWRALVDIAMIDSGLHPLRSATANSRAGTPPLRRAPTTPRGDLRDASISMRLSLAAYPQELLYWICARSTRVHPSSHKSGPSASSRLGWRPELGRCNLHHMPNAPQHNQHGRGDLRGLGWWSLDRQSRVAVPAAAALAALLFLLSPSTSTPTGANPPRNACMRSIASYLRRLSSGVRRLPNVRLAIG